MGRERISREPYKTLKEYTDDFSEENYIGKFQFGKVYRGKFQDLITGRNHVIVKIWEASTGGDTDNESRLMDEFHFLQHERRGLHPSLVKLHSYCCEDEKLGIVYALDSLDTVYNLMDKGGIFPDRTRKFPPDGYGRFGYIDPVHGAVGGWSEKCDVYSFGVLLLMLISKRVDRKEEGSLNDAPSICGWARRHYKPKKLMTGCVQLACSLVHRSLQADPDFCSSDGHRMIKLALRCVEYHPQKRPKMKNVVKYLGKLNVVKRYAGTFSFD
ncbi:hypothetical protein RJ640_024495 [Escallonia rubra]|uniref:non-specific serine/threonine protein kinase n=1 Tax=Escallonia rubra TaxID=112253 RepID=A0AA88QUA3_9ASTE|nr:hypothetical protein RJ640_024495 [Escallonia rubra]